MSSHYLPFLTMMILVAFSQPKLHDCHTSPSSHSDYLPYVGLLFLTATLLLQLLFVAPPPPPPPPLLEQSTKDVMYRFLTASKGASPTCSICSAWCVPMPSLSRSSSLVYPKVAIQFGLPRALFDVREGTHTYGFCLRNSAASTRFTTSTRHFI